jgi:hypothetical protein
MGSGIDAESSGFGVEARHGIVISRVDLGLVRRDSTIVRNSERMNRRPSWSLTEADSSPRCRRSRGVTCSCESDRAVAWLDGS